MAKQSYNRSANRADKLNLIKGLLNGSIKASALLAPKHHVIVQDAEGNYGFWMEGHKTKMNEEQFEVWKSNLNEFDTLVVLMYQPGNDPIIEDHPNVGGPVIFEDYSSNEPIERIEQKEAHNSYLQEQAIRSIDEKDMPVNEPIMGLEGLEDIIEIIPQEQPMKGLMSEYGVTWGKKENRRRFNF